MNLTLLFFLLLLGVSCSFYTPHRWYNKIYWIIAAMLSVVIGLRDFSVQDTENYAALYSGITGDLAGYFLQICELVMLTVVAFLGGIC